MMEKITKETKGGKQTQETYKEDTNKKLKMRLKAETKQRDTYIF
jgi:hypothetical protein